MEFIFALSTISLLLIVLNSLTIKVIKNKSQIINETISVLIPMRNEQNNVKECLESILNQKGLNNFEIIALDDESSDKTFEVLQTFRCL
mgnify:FL=1